MSSSVLFVHVPHFKQKMFTIALMPIGYFAMAEYLTRHDIHCEIIHLGIEKLLDEHFSLSKLIDMEDVDVVCFSIHWHYQLFDTIRIIDELKTKKPDIKVVVGGYTASFFGKEIMQRFENIDFLIKGEGEKPLLKLIQAINKGKNNRLNTVANLIWRDDAAVIENPNHYTASEKDLDELDFGRCDLLRNYELYTRLSEGGFLYGSHYNISKYIKTFMLCTGRGCSVNCFYCGGAKNAQKQINCRSRHIFRSIPSVMADINHLLDFGINCLFMDYDPDPKGLYYKELFQEVKKLNKELLACWTSWELPTKSLIDIFHETFMPNSIIILSADAGKESIRKKIKGFSYSNKALFQTLDHIATKSTLQVHIYFFVGNPFETEIDIEETFHLKETIEKKYPFTQVIHYYPEIEPASAFYNNPEKYQVTVHRNSLDDFYQYSKLLSDTPDINDIDISIRMGFESRSISTKKIDELLSKNESHVTPNFAHIPFYLRPDIKMIRSRHCHIEEFLSIRNSRELDCHLLAKNTLYHTHCELDRMDQEVINSFSQSRSLAELFTYFQTNHSLNMSRDRIERSLKKLIKHRIIEAV